MKDMTAHSAPLAPLIAEARERGLLIFLAFRKISYTPDEMEGSLAQGHIPDALRDPAKYRLVTPEVERTRLCHELDEVQDRADRLVKAAESVVLDHDRRIRDMRSSAKD